MTEKTIITRQALASILARNGFFSNKIKAKAAIDALLDLIGIALRAGDIVQFKGFGRFEAVDTPERPGRNPRTGESVTVTARRRVRFKANKKVLQGFIRDEEPNA